MAFSGCSIAKYGYVYTAFICLLAVFLTYPAHAFRPVAVEKTQYIKTLEGDEGVILILERAWAAGVVDVGMQRMQLRTEEGRTVAYTPTRISAIPFCPTLDMCWVFMWKTVYPLPAIFRFNPDRHSWTNNPHPPMQYSRGGNDGEGFIKKTNPLFGLWGVVLLIVYQAKFFLIFVALSVVLFIQINKFRDLPEIQQLWIRRVLMVLTAPIPIPFIPMEPFMITAMLIFAGSWMSIDLAGIPTVLSMLVSIATFFICSMIVASLKVRKRVKK